MADKIDISAIARVIDQASGPLKTIQGAIKNVGDMAKTAGASLASFARQGAFGGVAANLRNVRSQFANVGAQVRNLVAPLAKVGALFGIAGIAGTIAAMKEYVSTAAQLGRAAGRLGITVEGLQAFSYMTGDAEIADNALNKLQKTMTVMAAGGKPAQKLAPLFQRMGVSLAEIKAGNMDVILPKIADAFERNVNPTTRARMALALFGKSGQQIIPFLAKGAAGLAEARAAMERLGIITTEQVQKAAELRTSFKDLGFAVQGMRNSIMAALLPAVKPIVDGMTGWIAKNREWIASGISQAVETLIGAAKVLWTTLDGVVQALGGWQTVLIAVGAVMSAQLIGSVLSLAGALLKLGISAIALNPLSLAIGGVAAGAVAAYRNWNTFGPWIAQRLQDITGVSAQTWTSVANAAEKSVDSVIAAWKRGGIAAAVLQAVTEVRKHWGSLGPFFDENFPRLAATAREAWAGVSSWALQALEDIKAGWQSGGLIGAVQAYFDALKTGATQAASWLQQQFAQIDWSALGTSAGNLLSTAFQSVVDLAKWLKELPWEDAGYFIGQALGTALKVAIAAADWIITWIGQQDWQAIANAGLEIGVKLAEGMIRGILDSLGLGWVAEWGDKAAGFLNRITGAGQRATDQDFSSGIVAAAAQDANVIPFPARPAPAAAPLAGAVATAPPAAQQPSLLRQGMQAMPVRLEGEVRQRLRVDMSPDLRAMLVENRASNNLLRPEVDVGLSMGAAMGEAA